MDLLGPFPPVKGGRKYVVVVIDYFTKWVEAEPLASITSQVVQCFFWKNIICRFGVPREITVDNRAQFYQHHSGNYAIQSEPECVSPQLHTPRATISLKEQMDLSSKDFDAA